MLLTAKITKELFFYLKIGASIKSCCDSIGSVTKALCLLDGVFGVAGALRVRAPRKFKYE
jgi:hypothetical protein